jgi:DNA-binding response OmpR family regulator
MNVTRLGATIDPTPEQIILVVEDNNMGRKDMVHALIKHKVILAGSVEEAKLRYDECRPNLSFLDINLPDGSGFEVLDYIRSKEPDAYVIMVTGSKIESDVLASQKRGARGYVVKPFTISRLKRHLAQFLRYRETQIYPPPELDEARGNPNAPGAMATGKSAKGG